MNLFGITSPLDQLARLVDEESRSICPENPTGEKGGGARAADGVAATAARDLGAGWKMAPYIVVAPETTSQLADIAGPGAIRHVWATPAGCPWRQLVLRVYWDDQPHPSIECPLGDFFAYAWGGLRWARFRPVVSPPVCVNPGSALNCFWPMPFRTRCRITLENLSGVDVRLYYQVNYALGAVGDDTGYLHAHFRRSNPLPERTDHTLLARVRGRGHYVGTYLTWAPRSNGWWGEGEVKFYLDGDREWPTIVSTGTEDYFLGSYNFWSAGRYHPYTTAYAGLDPQVPDGSDPDVTQSRFGMYRWHLTDPVRFTSDLRVTVQALGWRPDGRYLPLRDDVSSVAFWYQDMPGEPLPPLPSADELEII